MSGSSRLGAVWQRSAGDSWWLLLLNQAESTLAQLGFAVLVLLILGQDTRHVNGNRHVDLWSRMMVTGRAFTVRSSRLIAAAGPVKQQVFMAACRLGAEIRRRICCGGGNDGRAVAFLHVTIEARFDAFPFGASILEPNLDLHLAEIEQLGYFRSLVQR